MQQNRSHLCIYGKGPSISKLYKVWLKLYFRWVSNALMTVDGRRTADGGRRTTTDNRQNAITRALSVYNTGKVTQNL